MSPQHEPTYEAFLLELTKVMCDDPKGLAVAAYKDADGKLRYSLKGTTLDMGQLLAMLGGHFVLMTYIQGKLDIDKSAEVFVNLVKQYAHKFAGDKKDPT